MVAVDVDTFQQTAAIPTTQQGFGGGIWQGAADLPPTIRGTSMS